MRKLFPGHYMPTEREFESLWKDGIFIFDTNVLLDLYRYSDNTVTSILDAVELIKDRIWIPYQVSKEYHKNLNNVISEQVRKYDSTIKTLTDFKKQIDEKRSHPFLNENLTKEIEVFCEKFDKELDTKKELVKKLILRNPIKEKIADLTEGKVGEKFTSEELLEIYQEGESRYKNQIPPGFSDKSKPSPEKFGDLIFWKEILKFNRVTNKPILLITGDKKEDWYLKELGLTIGPRPELVEEFKKIKDNLLYIYPTDKFLEYIKEYLKFDIDDETIKEVGEFVLENTEHSEALKNEGFSDKNESDIDSDILDADESDIDSDILDAHVSDKDFHLEETESEEESV